MWIVIAIAFIAFCVYSVFSKSYSESDELTYEQMKEGFIKEFGEPTIEINTWGEDADTFYGILKNIMDMNLQGGVQ